MIFYIADTHFGDERIMKLARRPYNSVEQMNNDIINKWNKVVSCEDTVYIIGDFAFDKESAKLVNKLNGKKHLILGNHDKYIDGEMAKGFLSVNQILTIEDEGRSVCLCHYPLMSYENSIYGGFHIFGHIHNNENDIAYTLQRHIKNIFNASSDMIGFAPKTLNQLIEMKRNFLI